MTPALLQGVLEEVGEPMEDLLSNAVSVSWAAPHTEPGALEPPMKEYKTRPHSRGDHSIVSSGSPTHTAMKDPPGLISATGAMETKLMIMRGND